MITIQENDKRFFIAKSNIPGAGLGVFAKVEIEKGDFMEVVGVMVGKNSICEQCTHYANDYKFAAAEKNATRAIIPMGLAAIVNHALDEKSANMWMTWLKGTSMKNQNASSLVLRAVKTIRPNDECLHYYGEQWNEHVRWKQEAIATLNAEKEEWEKFLSYKLYNLDLFDSFIPNNKIRPL